MKKSIMSYISKAVYLVIALNFLFLFIQIASFVSTRQSVQQASKINSLESDYFALSQKISRIESDFRNYSAGYIPSSNQLEILIDKCAKEIQTFIEKYPKIANEINFNRLTKNFQTLDNLIHNYLALPQDNAQKQIILKEINESFFINNLIFTKEQKAISKRNQNIANKIGFSVILNLFGVLFTFLIIIFAIFYFIKLKKLIHHKILFVQQYIGNFSLHNFAEKPNVIQYQAEDEFKEIVETFNAMIEKIFSQHNSLKQRENRFRNLYNNHPDALTLMDKNQNCIDCNNAALKLFGFENIDDFIQHQRSLSPAFQSDNQSSIEKANEYIQTALRKNKCSFDWTFMKQNGTLFEAEVLLTKLEVEGNLFLQETIRDVTAKKQEEERQIQAQKMESIGTLAGGMAHDFNNVLSGIVGSVSLLNLELSEGEIEKEALLSYISMIEKSSNRAQKIVEKLLLLSRKQDVNLQKINLNEHLKNVLEIAQNSLDKSVLIHPSYAPSNAYIFGDATQIEQVILNFAINAAHAMTIMRPKEAQWGGNLYINIETVNDFTPPELIDVNPGNYWKISIKDEGVGISKKMQKKIFTPFFTTKDKGVGTGLGLSMVYSIIKKHNGHIHVYSELGVGTTFSIYFPAIIGEKNTRTTNLDTTFELPHYDGNVLVIDDEKIMQKMAKDILSALGLNVEIAENGIIGLEKITTNPTRYKFILLDMVMPKMSGQETFYHIKKINESIPILLSSGFKHDDRVQTLLKEGVQGFLQKPYTISEMANAIGKILV